MIYTEDQLSKLSNIPFKYEESLIIKTHTKIRDVLTANLDRDGIAKQHNMGEYNLDIFLQGSYKNSTAISKSSDVDIVVRLENVQRKDLRRLSSLEKEYYERDHSTSQYSFNQYRTDVYHALVKEFGGNITNGTNSLQLKNVRGYADADIVPAITYKNYEHYENPNRNRYKEGICFDTHPDGITVINYPKAHYDNLVLKSKASNGNMKETIRMFKNLNVALIENNILTEDTAKSYFIENLLYNLPAECFAGSYTERFNKIIQRLLNDYNVGHIISNYICANHEDKLISTFTWNMENCREFIEGLLYIQNHDQF
jgi:hypothetical protein